MLQQLIDARGISVRELARRLNEGREKPITSPATIGRWLDGTGDPRLSELYAIAEFFDVPLAVLVGGQGEAHPVADDEVIILSQYRSLKNMGVIDQDRAVTGLALAAQLPAGVGQSEDAGSRPVGVRRQQSIGG